MVAQKIDFFIPLLKIFSVCGGWGLKTESGKFLEILTSVWGAKNFLAPSPQIGSVCGGGLKTESAKFHEILTSVWGV